jgi:uncharacterized RDD family membrane protein YckC
MKCKRCRAMVADDASTCPNCGQDLSSLRQLLRDFYSEDQPREEEQEISRSEPEIIPQADRKDITIGPDEIRIVTGPTPGYGHEASWKDVLLEEESEEEEEETTSSWDWALRGGFWVRSMAFATDQVILLLLLAIFVVLGFLTLTMGVLGGREIPLLRQVRIVLPVILPLALVLNLAYFTFFHGTWGQTFGKMIFGLRVMQPDGRPLTYSRSLFRTMGYLLSAIPLFLGFLWVGFTSSKRSWHDFLADTIVVREQ